MGKSGSHDLSKSFKELLDAFGIEWREVRIHFTVILEINVHIRPFQQAAGEAEAELAYLNRTGVIDAVMTDDVDAFVFGATTVIKKCE